MNKNEAIHIFQVGNGFIVMPVTSASESYMVADSSTEVFVTMGQLNKFLREHFDHRGTNEKPALTGLRQYAKEQENKK